MGMGCHGCPSLYTPRVLAPQTAQALEDMLQALVMEGLDPNMVMLQEVLEVSGWLQGQGRWNPLSLLVL